MSGHFHICSFSSLDDLPKKLHSDEQAVLAALKKAGRFSIFEMEGALATTVMRLIKSGKIIADNEKYGFPWTAVTVPEPTP